MDSSVTTRDLFRYTWHYWQQNTKYLYLTVALLIVNCVINNSVVPLYVRYITDLIASTPLPVNGAAYHQVWHYFWIFAAASLSQSVMWAAALLCWNYFSSYNLYRASGDALYKVQRFSADWHANAFAGGTVRKITRGVGAFDTFSDRLITGFFVVFVVMITTIATLAAHLPWVALFMATMVALYFWSSLYFSRKYLLPLFQRVAQADTNLGSTLADIMTGIPTIKAFATEEREDDLFHGVRLEWRKRAIKAWQVSRIIDSVRTLIRLGMLSGMLGITILLWARGQATPGDVAFVLTCFFMTQNLLRDMGVFISDLQRAMAEMEDIVYFWKYEDDVRDKAEAGALTTEVNGGGIVFDHVMFQYKNTNAPVYQDLSVEIRSGERVALVGPSGSGKSTFVKLLQRLYDIQGGTITIDGQNIADVTQQSLRSKVALVPQDPILFHRSIAENIAYGQPNATRDQIESAAKKAYAHRFIMSFPQGYDTLVGERGVKLSGGERQRVAIARAILADAPILVMDEATSSLDSMSEHYIQQALENLMRGRTVITIAHRLATIRNADRILVFENGQIAEQGAHNDLLENPNSLYKKLYDMQALGLVDDGIKETEGLRA